MFAGVLQKLIIVDHTEERLILRELPLLELLIAGAIFLAAINLAILEFWITAVVAVALGVFFVFQAKARLIIFDVAQDGLQIRYQSLIGDTIVNEMSLQKISRAYLKHDNNDYTQIVLVTAAGEDMGLSVYSRDMKDWKSDIVFAINALLYKAHQDDEDENEKNNKAIG